MLQCGLRANCGCHLPVRQGKDCGVLLRRILAIASSPFALGGPPPDRRPYDTLPRRPLPSGASIPNQVLPPWPPRRRSPCPGQNGRVYLVAALVQHRVERPRLPGRSLQASLRKQWPPASTPPLAGVEASIRPASSKRRKRVLCTSRAPQIAAGTRQFWWGASSPIRTGVPQGIT